MGNSTTKRKKHRYPGVRPTKAKNKWLIDWVDFDFSRRTKTFYGSENDAARARMMLLVERDKIINGIKPPPRQYLPRTISDLFDNFVKSEAKKVKSKSISVKTLDRYKCSIKAFVRCMPFLLNRKINELMSQDFEDFKIQRLEDGVSEEGVNTDLRSLKRRFNFALDNNFIDRSPLKQVKRIRTNKKDVRWLSKSEVNRMKSACKEMDLDDSYEKDARDVSLFLLFSGARSSEITFPKLTWECISEDKIVFPETKTKVSRSIPMSPSLKRILDSRSDIKGGPFHLTPDLIYNRVKYKFKLAGIRKSSPQTLRRTAGAFHYMANTDIFSTSQFLGHSNVLTTQRYYVGLIQSLQKENSLKFDKLLTQC